MSKIGEILDIKERKKKQKRELPNMKSVISSMKTSLNWLNSKLNTVFEDIPTTYI